MQTKAETPAREKRCPLCQKLKIDFEVHHVIWKTDGGTNAPVNLLEICKSCHTTINNGDRRDAASLEIKCVFHQLCEHGLSFVLQSGLLTGRHSLKDRLLNGIEALPADASALEADLQLKEFGQLVYNDLVTQATATE